MNALDQKVCQTIAADALELMEVGLKDRASFPGAAVAAINPDLTYVDVLVVVAPNASRQAAIGSTEIRTNGTLAIQLRVPATDAIDPVLAKADAIAAYIWPDKRVQDDPVAVNGGLLFSAPTVVRGVVFKTHRLITVSTPWQSWRSAAA